MSLRDASIGRVEDNSELENGKRKTKIRKDVEQKKYAEKKGGGRLARLKKRGEDFCGCCVVGGTDWMFEKVVKSWS